MDSNKKTARIAGVWYLILALTGFFGLMYVPSVIISEGNTALTAQNIVAYELLFRFGMVANITGQIAFLFLALSLYKLFKPVDKILSRVLIALVTSAVPIMFVNIIIQSGALIAVNSPGFINAFEQAQQNNLAMFFLNLYENGIAIVAVFWGLWLLPFGLLVYKSGFLPKFLGILLVTGFVCYMIDSLSYLLIPQYYKTITQIIMLPQAVGELTAVLWLLIAGAKDNESVQSG